MPTPPRGLTLPEFVQLLAGAALTRTITAVHIHHTWRPRRRDFRGAATIEAMRRFHIETNQWIDIAQHLTIDPEGAVWPGRNWNLPPASAAGSNGTASEGPFMIEMIGDFDLGQDPFDGAQRDAAIQIVARLLQTFDLTPDALKFHRDLRSAKTCPGSGIDFGQVQSAVAEALSALPPRRRPKKGAPSPFDARYVSRPLVAVDAAGQPRDAEVPENAAAAAEIDRIARVSVRTKRTTSTRTTMFSSRDAQCGAAEWNVLKTNAINLSKGVLSEGGQFCTSPDDLAAVVDAISAYAASTDHPHVVLYAHGGLVDETTALAYAKTVLPWWRSHGVFPVFFIWESGLLEILRQYIVGPRDIWDYITDPAIEAIAKIPGSAAWGGMKESALLASSSDAGEGHPGGALQFAKMLAPAITDHPFTVHAVGHSAGAIFHAHLLPALRSLGVTIETLALLAPAVRVDVFKQNLLPLVGDGIRKLACFTMQEDAERQDDCFGVYRKSLLYLVSRAFEGASIRKPILGLEEFIRKDDDLARLFGVKGSAGRAELQLSYAQGHPPNPLTRALRHGDFDNDPQTMGTVLRRVLDQPDDTHLGEDDFPYRLEPRTLPRPASAISIPGGHPTSAMSAPAPAATGTRKARALCIGIDKYERRPLAGCVKDARTWGAVLQRLGFEVTYLLDADATREAIIAAMQRLVGSATAGAPVVLQYSGHGTQMPDDSGDEVDGYDEAFVPVDYHLGHLLLDDDIASLLQKLQPDVTMTLFMDCCHSGTNSRFAPIVGARSTTDDRVRFLPPSTELVQAHRAFRARVGASTAGAAEESLPGVVHFAACQDNEYAWESAGQGDFTGAATPLLLEAVASGHTNEDFMKTVQRDVGKKGRQHPQLMRLPKGLANRPLLAGAYTAV